MYVDLVSRVLSTSSKVAWSLVGSLWYPLEAAFDQEPDVNLKNIKGPSVLGATSPKQEQNGPPNNKPPPPQTTPKAKQRSPFEKTRSELTGLSNKLNSESRALQSIALDIQQAMVEEGEKKNLSKLGGKPSTSR